ncbi:hypothetical protein H6G36_09625 [Anabaena minutissima FACHB-250]|nr:hypothetical protein [Anabaena minutissima FACHB-250]
MLRVYHLLIGAFLLISLPVGAKFILPQFSDNKIATTTPSVTPPSTTSTKTSVKAENIWQKVLSKTTAPNGWEVKPCQDNVTLLCVSEQGERLGTVEIVVYPVNNNPEFQKHLTASGIPLGSQADYQNQEYQAKVIKVLQAWVADFNTSFVKNRQGVYGNKVVFSTYPPQQVKIGKLPGIRYGLVGIKSEGGVEEQHIGHVTYDGAKLYVVTTSFAPGTGKFAKLENLAIFQPYLYAIAENLNLPMKGSGTKP